MEGNRGLHSLRFQVFQLANKLRPLKKSKKKQKQKHQINQTKKPKILIHWTSFGMVTRPSSIALVEFVTSPGHRNIWMFSSSWSSNSAPSRKVIYFLHCCLHSLGLEMKSRHISSLEQGVNATLNFPSLLFNWIFICISSVVSPPRPFSPSSRFFSTHPYRSYKHFWQAPAADTTSSWASSTFRKAPRAPNNTRACSVKLEVCFSKRPVSLLTPLPSQRHVRHGGLQSNAVVTAEDKKLCLGLQSLFCWVSIAKQDFAVALKRVILRFLFHIPKNCPELLAGQHSKHSLAITFALLIFLPSA